MKRLVKADPDAPEAIRNSFETSATAMAPKAGICDPNGHGSLTHPKKDRIVVGDGKVIKPLYKAKKGMRRVDKATGEILGEKNHDPDAKMHTTGGGHPVWDNKFVIFAARREGEWHSRWIVGLDHVPTAGGEAKAAMPPSDAPSRRYPAPRPSSTTAPCVASTTASPSVSSASR